MKIAFVADTLHGWIGGGIIAGRRLVEELRREHDVLTIGADVPGPNRLVFPGFRLPGEGFRRMDFTMAYPHRPTLRRAFERVDLVHLHFPFWLSLVSVRVLRKMRRRPGVVASFHVQPENALMNLGVRSKTAARLMYRLWVDHLYDRADAVICPTHFAEAKLREHGLRAPTYVISNGASPDLRERSYPREPAHRDRLVVLSVGRLSPEKRPEVLIDAVMRSRHRHRIVLIFAGAGLLEQALIERARALPNAPEIGFVSRERLEYLLNIADLFVHGSEVELEGMAVLEAMSTGRPVLVADSRESAASSFALDDRFRFACGDPRALAEKLDALLDDPALLAEAGARSRSAARQLDFDRSTQSIVDVYRGVLARR